MPLIIKNGYIIKLKYKRKSNDTELIAVEENTGVKTMQRVVFGYSEWTI